METADTGSATVRISPHAAVVDIELTSRCNANCSFCPRDQTPHQGLIDEPTFTAALRRAVDYRDALLELQEHAPGYFDTHDDTIWLSFCGMGEPLLHPRVVEYVGRAAEAGLRPIINTNGALLSPRTAEQLMDAGLRMVCLNVGEVDDQYEAVYGLPFERTRSNVEHFLETAAGRCIAIMVLVDHRNDPDHARSMRQFWSQRGADAFYHFSLVNRAGSLAIDEQVAAWQAHRDAARALLQERGSTARCSVPFLYPFIGYDGNYYLCSSDWRKEVNLGNVFERSLADLLDDKAEQVRRGSICRDCTNEPTNALALSLARGSDDRTTNEYAQPNSTPEGLLAGLAHHAGCVAAMHTHMPRSAIASESVDREPASRRLIPVRSC
jgi:MoaA/NifB/PqqE/SkfB family radical SAM enzyme